MTATITAQDAITAVHEAAQLGGDTGMTIASIQAITGLFNSDLMRALNLHARRGTMSHVDGRWVAWEICRTCGHGIDDRLPPTVDHPEPGVCRVHPADRCAGYPLNR